MYKLRISQCVVFSKLLSLSLT